MNISQMPHKISGLYIAFQKLTIKLQRQEGGTWATKEMRVVCDSEESNNSDWKSEFFSRGHQRTLKTQIPGLHSQIDLLLGVE